MGSIQHKASDRQASRALRELLEGREPAQTLLNGLNGHTEVVEAVMEGYRKDGVPGARVVFETQARKDPSLYTLLSDPDPSTSTDPDYATTDAGKRVFKTLSMGEIDELPDIEWLVNRVLQHSTVSLLYGDSNAGKTFIALDIMMHVALGKPWMGRRIKQGRVLYIYAEGRLGLKPRMQAWKKHYSAQNTDQIGFIARPVHLVADKDLLCDTIESLPERPSVVVIDTFSMCAPDTNENAANEVARVLAVASHIKHTYGCHVMVVHHAGKNGDYRGSAAFKGNTDTMIEVSTEGKGSPVRIECKKQRDGAYFVDIWVKLEVVELGTNPYTQEPITSCVVVSSEPGERTSGASYNQQLLLNTLDQHKELTNAEWMRLSREGYGTTKDAFNGLLKGLREKKLVEKDGEGVGAKYRKAKVV